MATGTAERLQQAEALFGGAVAGLDTQLHEIRWIEERRDAFDKQAQHTPDEVTEMSHLAGTHGALVEHLPALKERVRDLETFVERLERLLGLENRLGGQPAIGAELTQSIERERNEIAKLEVKLGLR